MFSLFVDGYSSFNLLFVFVFSVDSSFFRNI